MYRQRLGLPRCQDRLLRLSAAQLFDQPPTNIRRTFAVRVFAIAAPTVWNSLSVNTAKSAERFNILKL